MHKCSNLASQTMYTFTPAVGNQIIITVKPGMVYVFVLILQNVKLVRCFL